MPGKIMESIRVIDWGTSSNIDNEIYPDNFSDGIKNIRRKPEKFSSSLIIGYGCETTRSTSLDTYNFTWLAVSK